VLSGSSGTAAASGMPDARATISSPGLSENQEPVDYCAWIAGTLAQMR
jgi:hypothetical protein